MNAVLPAPTFSRPFLSYLGLLQFLFLASWIVYVIFLGDLLARIGAPKDWLPKLLLADQILFLVADIALGYAADRLNALWGRIAPLLVGLNLLSCLSFLLLPHTTAPSVFIALTVVWVLSASVLRAPLYGLIARRSSQPQHGTAAALLGMGLASAAAPYLGQLLKGIDPALPFLLSALSLAAATLGFAAFERQVQAATASTTNRLPTNFHQPLRLFAVAILAGGSIQLHFFSNSAALFKQVADAAWLPWLMPVFWAAFSLFAWVGGAVIERLGPGRALAWGTLGGAIALACCWVLVGRGNLPVLAMLQILAGASWAAVFLAGLTLAGQLGGNGSGGREALFIAGWFACLAVATAMRIGLNMTAPALDVTLALATALACAGALLMRPWLGMRRSAL